MAKPLEQSQSPLDLRPVVAANEEVIPWKVQWEVAKVLDGEPNEWELPNRATWKTPEKYQAPAVSYVATHFQCLDMHGYNRPDGTWVIWFLEDSTRIDEKITDFPIKPSNDDLIRIKEIQSKHQDNWYILCSPRTIIKLLLWSEQLVEHIQNDDEVGYFRFHIDGASIWLVAHKDYRDFPKYLAWEAS